MTNADVLSFYTFQGLPVPEWLHAEAALEEAIASGKECPLCGSHDVEKNGSHTHQCGNCLHEWGHDNGERFGF